MADRAPVFCMFDVTLHQDLALALGRERTVIGLHAPRLHVPGRGRPLCKAIAARYVASIRGHQAHGPYHLVGLRFGGLVAYEAARQLEALGERVASVVIVDAVLPHAGAWLAPHALWQRLGRQRARLAARVRHYLWGRAAGGHEPIDVARLLGGLLDPTPHRARAAQGLR